MSTRPQTLSEEEQEAQKWDFPFVEDTRAKPQQTTNAFNKRSDWKYEPPEEVEEILPPTAQEIEQIRAEAFQDGYKDGHQQGLTEGREEGLNAGHREGQEAGHSEGLEQGLENGKEQIEALVQQWQALMESLHQPVSVMESTLEKELVNLAVSLARSVIRVEVKSNKDVIFQALSEGLKILPIQQNQYQVHLNPQDIELIKQHFDEQEIDKHNWVFIDAPQMSRGGCEITTEANAVDVSVERRCKEVLDRFLLDQGYDSIESDS